jgi:sulfur-oxidizing protein SoxX
MREETIKRPGMYLALAAAVAMGAALTLAAWGVRAPATAAEAQAKTADKLEEEDPIVVVREPGLKPYKVVYGSLIPERLTKEPGDWKRGRELMANRKKGNCLACHRVQQMMDFPFHGNVGPEISDIALRMTEAELRLRLVNPKILNPDTIMPAFYRVQGLHRVAKKFQGKPILTEQEIEDIIAYLRKLYMVVR